MTATVAVIVKNEAHSIKEWIAHYLALKFDSVVVYDNHSTDGTAEICHALGQLGIIKYKSWPDAPYGSDMNAQLLAYRDMQGALDTDWVLFCDSDEFLVLEKSADIAEFLSTAGQSGMPIALSWKVFGSSGELQRRPELVTQRFKSHAKIDFHANAHIKTLGPVKLLFGQAESHIHGWILKRRELFYVDATGKRVDIQGCTFLTPPCWQGAWLNHYIVKSLEEFEEKRQRGRADKALGKAEKFSRTFENYFVPYDRNEVSDSAIDHHKDAMLIELEKIENLMRENSKIQTCEPHN